ncbi:MAG: hypothetical protein IKN16_09760 [Selenomonadaceae bacterium]|nr:hypothetical protein [Selenomonadaceae bacterium]
MAAKGALLKTAENNLNSLGNALSKKLGTTINSGGEVDESKLTGSKLKDSFTKSGSSAEVPEEVYKKIAEAVYDKIDQSIFSEYSTDKKS